MHIFLFIALIEIIVIIGVLFWPTKTKALRNHLCIKCSKIKIINLFRVMECFPHVYINYSRDEWQQCYQNVNKPVPLCRAMYSQWNLDLYCKKRWDFEMLRSLTCIKLTVILRSVIEMFSSITFCDVSVLWRTSYLFVILTLYLRLLTYLLFIHFNNYTGYAAH